MAARLEEVNMADPAYQSDLGDGLVRRWSTAADTEKIAHLMAQVFREEPTDPPSLGAADEARRLMGGTFPFMGAGDYAIVEDTRHSDCPVVAASAYWRMLWSYDGIPFGVGRPENIGTEPAYRRRGLVRALLEMVHARSAAEGNPVDAITGIPNFYRQFGYEYVLDLSGRQSLHVAALPEPKQEDAPYSLRLATFDDIPTLMRLYQRRRGNSLVWHESTEAYWRYQIGSWHDPSTQWDNLAAVGLFSRTYMIVEGSGTGGEERICGHINLGVKRRGKVMRVFALELEATVNLQVAVPCLIQLVRDFAQKLGEEQGVAEPLGEIIFHLGRNHPAYQVFDPAWVARVDPPYAWYVRVADLPAFLQRIAPVLEKRLAQSVLIGYSGELRINFYRSKLLVKFEGGKLDQLVSLPADPAVEDADMDCPSLIFLQLLFGYRGEAELRATFPDVLIGREVRLLVATLFPTLPSTVFPLL